MPVPLYVPHVDKHKIDAGRPQSIVQMLIAKAA